MTLPTKPAAMWDERYSAEAYVYGTAPNYLVSAEAARIPPGPVVCLAEGEGRNAVFLAARGHAVTAVDFSRAGLDKAARLSRDRGVSIDLVHADLADYALGEARWSGVVAIWAHLSPDLRREVNRRVVRALVPGGCLILEAYTPAQLAHGTGGPRDVSLLMTLAALREELEGLDLVVAREVEREVHEGTLHEGQSATVQVVGVKRA